VPNRDTVYEYLCCTTCGKVIEAHRVSPASGEWQQQQETYIAEHGVLQFCHCSVPQAIAYQLLKWKPDEVTISNI